MELPTLRDGDLVLRPKRPDDLDAITAACQDPEIPRWTFVPSPYTRADAEAYFARSAEEAAAGKAVLPHKDNLPSRRVAEKAGFRDSGELVGSPRAGLDDAIYARYLWEST